MKNTIVLGLLSCGLLAAPHAFALTRAQAIKDYNGCLTFLKSTPAQKKKIAARVGETVEDGQEGCELAKRLGEAAGLPASTIHRLLEYSPKENRFLRAALLKRLAACPKVELVSPDEVVDTARDLADRQRPCARRSAEDRPTLLCQDFP